MKSEKKEVKLKVFYVGKNSHNVVFFIDGE